MLIQNFDSNVTKEQNKNTTERNKIVPMYFRRVNITSRRQNKMGVNTISTNLSIMLFKIKKLQLLGYNY